ncbi:MAG TPA: DUF3267 domain-containing protein [Ktedonobacterales bacterium]|nr:DUF3267 domain-containing protein [Ktedonobacterales bacterium]
METRETTRTLRLVARFSSRALRARYEAAIRAGRLSVIARIELLAPERIQHLARQSLTLLAGSALGFLALDTLARAVQHVPPLGAGASLAGVAALIGANILAYIAVLPIHEALHAAIILALGGRPTFGLQLPFAAYCTASYQLFTRNGYIAVALAPLVILTAAGIVLTWFAPNLALYLLLGFTGNVAGAVGDLAAVAALRRLASDTLIEDTATGFIAYAITE